MPGWIGPWELVFLVLILLLIFGPKRLPSAGRSLGKGIREFKDSVSGMVDSPEEKAPARSEPKAITPPATGSDASRLSEELRVERRERLIERAQHEGRFGPDQADDYRKLYDADPGATEKVIDKLPASTQAAATGRDD